MTTDNAVTTTYSLISQLYDFEIMVFWHPLNQDHVLFDFLYQSRQSWLKCVGFNVCDWLHETLF